MPVKKLSKLGDDHRAAVRMKIEGRTGEEIARALEVRLRTVYLWFSDPLVKQELDAQRQQIAMVFVERMSEVGMRAIHKLEELAEVKMDQETVTVEQKLEIIREILDRIPLTSKKGVVGGNYGTPSVPIPPGVGDGPAPETSDEQLLREFKEVAALVPGITIESPNGHRK